MNFDREFVLSVAQRILTTDSPAGYTDKAMELVGELAGELGFPLKRTNKGNGVIILQGTEDKTVGLCAHIDTLGLMVRAVKPSGTLAITKIGGPLLPTLDGEYCRIYTRRGGCHTGTILCTSPAAHVFTDADSRARTEENLEIRLDEVVKTAEDVKALGIAVGDFICIDPKTVVTSTGFIKSRFLDDKLSVALLLGVLKCFKDSGKAPRPTTALLISTYEEVGHGMAHLPFPVDELLAVDMGCIGDDLTCTEYDVSICAKDSTGPYDYELTGRLIDLAQKSELSYAVDIYPRYGSDVSAARSAGHDIRGALIGPGVHASHGMERSHWLGCENTMRLIAAYLS